MSNYFIGLLNICKTAVTMLNIINEPITLCDLHGHICSLKPFWCQWLENKA